MNGTKIQTGKRGRMKIKGYLKGVLMLECRISLVLPFIDIIILHLAEFVMMVQKISLPYRCNVYNRRYALLSELQSHVLNTAHDDYEIIEVPDT
jgi:hypothetical protein